MESLISGFFCMDYSLADVVFIGSGLSWAGISRSYELFLALCRKLSLFSRLFVPVVTLSLMGRCCNIFIFSSCITCLTSLLSPIDSSPLNVSMSLI